MNEAHAHRTPAEEAAARARKAPHQAPADRQEPTRQVARAASPPLADVASPMTTMDVSALLRQAAQRLHDETATRDRAERSRETPRQEPAGRAQQTARETAPADVREPEPERSPERAARGWGQSWDEQEHPQEHGRQR